MALALIPGLFLQRPIAYVNPSFAILDAAGEQAASIMRVPASGNIVKVGVHVGVVTISKPLRISLQTVSATTGLPTGTMYKGSTAVVLASIVSNTFYQATLGTQATNAVRGDLVAIVAEWDSADSGNTRILNCSMGSTSSAIYSSWAVQNVGGAGWVKNAYPTVGSLEYSDGTHYCIPDVFGFIAGSAVYQVGTAVADEYGNLFNLPVDVVLHGFLVDMTANATSATFDMCYYTDSTLTEAVSLLGLAHDGQITSGNWRYIPLLNDYTIVKNTNFRLTVRPTNTANITLPQMTYPSVAQMAQDGFTGAQCQQTARLDQGVFSETTTKRLAIFPWITQIHDGASGVALPGLGGLVR